MRLDADRVTLLVVGALLVVLAWKVAEPFWSYIVLGLLLAALAKPAHERLEGKLGRPRLAAGLTVTASVIVAVAPLVLVARRVVQDLAAFAGDLSVEGVVGQVETVMAWSSATLGYPAQVDTATARRVLQDVVPSVQAHLAAWIPGALQSTASMLLGLVVTLAVAYYALLAGEDAVAALRSASPMRDELEAEMLSEAQATVDGVVWGLVLTAVAQGALAYVAFVVTGVPNAFFWSFALAVLSFVQVVGAMAVWVPAAVYLLATGSTWAGVGMLLWGALVISSVDNIVKPWAIGDRSALHPLLAFVGVLGGLAAFGIMGFLIGPLVLSLLVVVFQAFARWDWSGEAGGPASGS